MDFADIGGDGLERPVILGKQAQLRGQLSCGCLSEPHKLEAANERCLSIVFPSATTGHGRKSMGMSAYDPRAERARRGILDVRLPRNGR